MTVILGGPNARAQYISRGYVVSFQYINDEPAMVIFPRNRILLNGGAMAICLSAAHRYADDDYLVMSATKGAEAMGIFSTKMDIFNLCQVINNYLEELVKMKPGPDGDGKVIGEGKLIDAGGKEINFNVTDSLH